MARTRVIVRPKGDGVTTLPRVERWLVTRYDALSGEETFTLECSEGTFFSVYRAYGLEQTGKEFNPYVDLEYGMQRVLLEVQS